MPDKHVWMFPGQGSQHVGMGQGLFDSIAEFSRLERTADELLGFSVRELCRADRANQLSKTQFTQPCLYTVNALHYYERRKSAADPAFVAGHSLGEFNALLAAGAFDFLTGLALVKRRGELMARASGGGMAAVLGMTGDGLSSLLAEKELSELDIANHNAPSQIVVSGPAGAIDRLAASLRGRPSVRCIPLPVSAPFHSRYMRDAASEFREFLETQRFEKLRLPVMSNVTGQAYPAQAGAEQIRDLLAKQMTQAVRWDALVRQLLELGATSFEELGPGNVLTKLVAQIREDFRPLRTGISAGPVSRPAAPLSRSVASSPSRISAEHLGNEGFRRDYGLNYAYVAGAMYKGIASVDMVTAMGHAGMLGVLGAGGLKLDEIDRAITTIQKSLSSGQSYGMNLLNDLNRPKLEEQTVELYLRRGVKVVEAAAYMQLSLPLVRFRLHGATRRSDGTVHCPNRVIAKVSRPEVARVFMEPAPATMLDALVAARALTRAEAELGRHVPVSQEICVEADSGGHTDRGVAYVLMPAMLTLRKQMMERHRYSDPIRVGAAGGIGTPEAAAAAFMLGADFILTGSINQCTVEAGTSDLVKQMLQEAEVQDTAYAPAGDMFELGAKVQVLRRGLLFPPRANKLFELYQRYDSLAAIDPKTLGQVQDQYFQRTVSEVWEETRDYWQRTQPDEVVRAENNPKYKMALVFKWYFVHTTRLAMRGEETRRVDFQIHCGPAMGAFNHWVKGTEIESWRNRRVADIAKRLLTGAAEVLGSRYAAWHVPEKHYGSHSNGKHYGDARTNS